jgi:hypothetical protein
MMLEPGRQARWTIGAFGGRAADAPPSVCLQYSVLHRKNGPTPIKELSHHELQDFQSSL